MAIHYAHLVMLVSQRIISVEDAHAIRIALDSVSIHELHAARYDGSCEDFFFYVERLIVKACGQDAAGRLHTARSRNDIDMTMYRMRQREFILALYEGTLALRDGLLDLADRHRDSGLPFTPHPACAAGDDRATCWRLSSN
jgi:argininosuccinate lyase